MSLAYVLLGMLQKPSSGWEIGRRFDGFEGLYWKAELSQIYPTLFKLEKKKWITSRSEKSEIGPDRRIYKLTALGRKQFRHWLQSGPQFRIKRLEHVAQLFFLHELDDPKTSWAFVKEMESILENRLRGHRAIESELFADALNWQAMSDKNYHFYAGLRQRIAIASTRLAWCRETLLQLEQRMAKSKQPKDNP